MSLATQRLVVPITAKDKARVERKAAKAGKISTAEFVRRAALNYEPTDAASGAELHSLVAGYCLRRRGRERQAHSL
jgi:Ribbon-helix-helix protein, copG family